MGYVWTLDKKFNSVRQSPIKSNCSLKYIYEADEESPTNLFENQYRREIEDKYGKDYARLVKARVCLQYINLTDKKMLGRLCSNFSARNPVNLYLNMRNQMLVSNFTLGSGIDKRIEKRWLLNVIPFSESNFEEELMKCGVNVLFSDEPIIIFGSCPIEQVNYEREYYFPICPYMLAHFSMKYKANDGVIRKISDDEYKRFIELYVKSKYIRQLYASKRDVLIDIQKNYGTSLVYEDYI